MNKTAYQVSCVKFTVLVAIDKNDVIIEAAPFVRKFMGQPLANLVRWAERFKSAHDTGAVAVTCLEQIHATYKT